MEQSSVPAGSSRSAGADGAIGVFDSGIGGLSVLRHIFTHAPHEHLLYFADSGFVPYGDKPESVIVARSLAIADFLLQRGAKALVIACNTATAASIKALRELYPALPLVGVEPGLKPAASLSASKTVGVLATERTLSSAKFKLLHEQLSATTGVRFLLQSCVGLADQVEKGELHSAATALLVQRNVIPLLEQGADTLVLGCTHYPFVLPLIEQTVQVFGNKAGPVSIIDTGEAVARQLARLLAQHGLQRTATDNGTLQVFTTGSESAMAHAFARLLQLQPDVAAVTTQPLAA